MTKKKKKKKKKKRKHGYNCSYVKVDSPRSFDEILYVLMNGTGVGFSVEEEYTAQMPVVPDELYETDTTIIVADSKLGWATDFQGVSISSLWWTYSKMGCI